jgi:superfamily II DNA or RNA helicase
MNTQLDHLQGDWFTLKSVDYFKPPEVVLKPWADGLVDVPGVRIHKSHTGTLMAIDVHRTHLPLLPPGLEGLESFPFFSESSKPSFKPNFELHDYQQEAVDFSLKRQGAMLLHGLGLGKTVMALSCIEAPSLVMVPTSAVSVWELEAAEMGISTQVLHGRKVDKSLITGTIADLYILTYGSAVAWMPYFKKLAVGPQIHTLIADEAHILHKRGLKWAQAFHSISRTRTLALTATPLRNRVKSLYGILSSVCGSPTAWGSLLDFRIRYGGAFQNEYGWQDGPELTNKDELALRLTEVAVTVDWTDSRVEHLRPALTREVIDVQVPGIEKTTLALDTLKEADGERLAWFTEQRKRISQLKLKYVIDQDFEIEARTIWWVWHKETAQGLYKAWKDCGRPIDIVTGDTLSKKRHKVLHEWKYGNPEEPRILIATIGAMSAATNLVTAKAAYFVELDWAPLNISQAEKRHHRPGSKFKEVKAYYLLIPGTIDDKLTRNLLTKVLEQDSILGTKDQKDQILDLLDQEPVMSDTQILEELAASIMKGE